MVLDRPIELLVLIPCKKVVVAGPIVLLVLIACSRLQTIEVKLGRWRSLQLLNKKVVLDEPIVLLVLTTEVQLREVGVLFNCSHHELFHTVSAAIQRNLPCCLMSNQPL